MDMIADSALFHLETAARKYQNLKAMFILAQKLLGLDTDELDELEIPKVNFRFISGYRVIFRMYMLDGN